VCGDPEIAHEANVLRLKYLLSRMFRLAKRRPLPFIPLCAINVQTAGSGHSAGLRSGQPAKERRG